MRAYNTLLEQENPTLLQFLDRSGLTPSQPRSRTGHFGSRFTFDEWALIYEYSNRDLIVGRSPRANTDAINRFYRLAGPDSPYDIPNQYAGALASQFSIPIESTAMRSWSTLEQNLRQILRQAQQWNQQDRAQQSEPDIEQIAQDIYRAIGVVNTREPVILRGLALLRNQEDYESLKQEFTRISDSGTSDLESYLQQFDNQEMLSLRRIFEERNIVPGFYMQGEPTSEFDVSRLVPVESNIFESEDEVRNYVAEVLTVYTNQLGERGQALSLFLQSDGEVPEIFRNRIRDLYENSRRKIEIDSAITALLHLINIQFESWYDENY